MSAFNKVILRDNLKFNLIYCTGELILGTPFKQIASPVVDSKGEPNTRDCTEIVYVNIICGEPLNIHVLIPDLQRRLQVEFNRTRTLETPKCSLGLPSFVDESLKCISAVRWLLCRERNGEEWNKMHYSRLKSTKRKRFFCVYGFPEYYFSRFFRRPQSSCWI